MPTITKDSLLTLEAYAKARAELRRAAITQKKIRKVFIGDNILLQFEDEQTIRYQIQEMLHAEKTFDEAGILDELEAYNPLVPDGSNWKATLMIEFTDVPERKQKLIALRGLERHIYVIADEDMPRENDEKTSAIHFMRFELTQPMVAAAKAGECVAAGTDHPAYTLHIDEIAPETQASLIEDLH
jgi:hypothetical protein